MRTLILIVAALLAIVLGGIVPGKTTPLSLYERLYDLDYATLQKGGFRKLPYTAPLRTTTYTFDLSAYANIYRIIGYTGHRTDFVSSLSFNIDGSPASLTNLGSANGDCWTKKNTIAYRFEKTYGCGSSPSKLVISDIPSNAVLNGFSLIVLYDDGNRHNNRDLVILNGNDVNYHAGTATNWGWNADVFVNPDAGNDVYVDFHISDVEWRDSEYFGSIYLQGVEVSSNTVNPLTAKYTPVNDAEYWDVETYQAQGVTDGQINKIYGSASAFVPVPAGQSAEKSQDCQMLIAIVVSTPTWLVRRPT